MVDSGRKVSSISYNFDNALVTINTLKATISISVLAINRG